MLKHAGTMWAEVMSILEKAAGSGSSKFMVIPSGGRTGAVRSLFSKDSHGTKWNGIPSRTHWITSTLQYRLVKMVVCLKLLKLCDPLKHVDTEPAQPQEVHLQVYHPCKKILGRWCHWICEGWTKSCGFVMKIELLASKRGSLDALWRICWPDSRVWHGCREVGDVVNVGSWESKDVQVDLSTVENVHTASSLLNPESLKDVLIL